MHNYFKFALQEAQDFEKSKSVLEAICSSARDEVEHNICESERGNLNREMQEAGDEE